MMSEQVALVVVLIILGISIRIIGIVAKRYLFVLIFIVLLRIIRQTVLKLSPMICNTLRDG